MTDRTKLTEDNILSLRRYGDRPIITQILQDTKIVDFIIMTRLNSQDGSEMALYLDGIVTGAIGKSARDSLMYEK